MRDKGPRPCETIHLAVRCDSIELPEYNLVAVNQRPGEGVGKNGAQKLPLVVEGYWSRQIFFHTEEVSKRYEGKLTDSITLEVTLNCKAKTITKTLSREDATNPNFYTWRLS